MSTLKSSAEDLTLNADGTTTWADTDISGEDARVQAIATATWTSAVKTAYQEQQDATGL